MKNKRIIACLIISAFAVGILSSCAIDRKCPAYTQNTVKNNTEQKG